VSSTTPPLDREYCAPNWCAESYSALIGSSEAELRRLYGARLDVQPHKYDPQGHTITYRSADGEFGLRFETSNGKVTAIQSGPWEHLHYVEGCS